MSYRKLNWRICTCIYLTSQPQQNWPYAGWAEDIVGGGGGGRGGVLESPPNGPDIFDVFQLPRHLSNFFN